MSVSQECDAGFEHRKSWKVDRYASFEQSGPWLWYEIVQNNAQKQEESIQIVFSWINQTAGVCQRGLEVFLRIVLIIVSIPFCF